MSDTVHQLAEIARAIDDQVRWRWWHFWRSEPRRPDSLSEICNVLRTAGEPLSRHDWDELRRALSSVSSFTARVRLLYDMRFAYNQLGFPEPFAPGEVVYL